MTAEAGYLVWSERLFPGLAGAGIAKYEVWGCGSLGVQLLRAIQTR